MNTLPRSALVAASSALLGVAVFLASATTGSARPAYINTWRTIYPNSTTDDNVLNGTGAICGMCHFTNSGGNNWNPYGWKIREHYNAGQSLTNAIVNAGPFDSDGDPTGASNLVEIDANTQPGWTPGPNNTRYTSSSTLTGQTPLANIAGRLDPCGIATNYCTAGTTTNDCTPTISTVGAPSASGAGAFSVVVNGVEGQKAGLIFYGLDRHASPWGSGTSFLCIKAPTQRTPVVNSGGTPDQCDGQLSVDMHAFWASHPGALGQPITAGMAIEFQGWFRDPPSPKTTNLSDALEVFACP